MSPFKSLSNDPKPRKARATKATSSNTGKEEDPTVSKASKATKTRTKRTKTDLYGANDEREDLSASHFANYPKDSDASCSDATNTSPTLKAATNVEQATEVATGKNSFPSSADTKSLEHPLPTSSISSFKHKTGVATEGKVTSSDERIHDASRDEESSQQPLRQQLSMIWIWENVPQQAGAGWASKIGPDSAIRIPFAALSKFLHSLPDENRTLTTHIVKPSAKRKLNIDSEDYHDAPNKRYKVAVGSLSQTEPQPTRPPTPSNFVRRKKVAATGGYKSNGSLILPGQELESSEDESSLPAARRAAARLRVRSMSAVAASRNVPQPFVQALEDSHDTATTHAVVTPQAQDTRLSEPSATPLRKLGSYLSALSPMKIFGYGEQSAFNFRRSTSHPSDARDSATPDAQILTRQNISGSASGGLDVGNTEGNTIASHESAASLQEDVVMETTESNNSATLTNDATAANDTAPSRASFKAGSAEPVAAVAETLNNDGITESGHASAARSTTADVLAALETLSDEERSAVIRKLQGKAAVVEHADDLNVESKKRKRSLKHYPPPKQGGYGFSYGSDIDSSDSDSDTETTGAAPSLPSQTGSDRPTKRSRLSKDSFSTPLKTVSGKPNQATPYTGKLLAERRPNVFDDHASSSKRASDAAKLDSPRTYQLNYDDSDSDSDDGHGPLKRTQTPNKETSAAKSVKFTDTSTAFKATTNASPKATSTPQNITESQPLQIPEVHLPPPPPTPAHAALPPSPITQEEKLRRSIAQATRYAPKQPSNLKIANRLSSSTVASASDIGDREEDLESAVVDPQGSSTANVLTETSGNEVTKLRLELNTRMHKVMSMVSENEFEDVDISPEVQKAINQVRPDDVQQINLAPSSKPKFQAQDPVVLEALKKNWGPEDDDRSYNFYGNTFAKLNASTTTTD